MQNSFSTCRSFNPRTRTGCDRQLQTSPYQQACFNPRTRTGCDRDLSSSTIASKSFNPRTRTGCDRKTRTFFTLLKVSIHAPARGATYWAIKRKIKLCVSIHAPARGATQQRPAYYKCPDVSIHAPARGATPIPSKTIAVQGCFNPRTRTGCDAGNQTKDAYTTRFNPRTRTGCDICVLAFFQCH